MGCRSPPHSIATEKGNINRQIAADNKLLKEIKARITRLYKWTKEQAGKPEGKDSIMVHLYEAQLSVGKPGSRYGKIKNLKESAVLFNFLNGNNITSMERLYEKVAAMNKDYYALCGKIVTAERRIKVLDEHLSMWEKYERNKGTRRQFDKMKPGKKKEQFEQKHSAELALYEAAVRYLEKLKANGEEVTPKKWQAEADRLKTEKSVQYQKMKSMREDIKAVENLKKTAEQLARTENEPARKKEEQDMGNRQHERIPAMDYRQYRRARRLVRECCHYDNGQNPIMEKAHAYVEHWKEAYRDNTGLLLFGDVGTGKSFFAGCIANALLDRDVPVLMTNFPSILNRLTGVFVEDRAAFIASLDDYSLLVIDDLGVERNTEYAMEQMFTVIDSRYRSKKPLIVTTNLKLEEIKNPPDLAHARIYDRILERCAPVLFSGKNFREEGARTTKAMAKEIVSKR